MKGWIPFFLICSVLSVKVTVFLLEVRLIAMNPKFLIVGGIVTWKFLVVSKFADNPVRRYGIPILRARTNGLLQPGVFAGGCNSVKPEQNRGRVSAGYLKNISLID